MKKALTFRDRQLRRDGPMFCASESCVEFRKREPVLAQQMQDAGIIAHYMGYTRGPLFSDETWMLDGITPINRAGLMRCIARRVDADSDERTHDTT